MGKKSQLQEALDKINREIDDLIQVRARLEAVIIYLMGALFIPKPALAAGFIGPALHTLRNPITVADGPVGWIEQSMFYGDALVTERVCPTGAYLDMDVEGVGLQRLYVGLSQHTDIKRHHEALGGRQRGSRSVEFIREWSAYAPSKPDLHVLSSVVTQVSDLIVATKASWEPDYVSIDRHAVPLDVNVSGSSQSKMLQCCGRAIASGVGTFVGGIGGRFGCRQGFDSALSLLSGIVPSVFDLPLQERRLLLGCSSRSSVREVGAYGTSSGEASEKQGPGVNAIRELRLRALFGIPLFLFGVWLIYYCDGTIKGNPSWFGWLLWLCAAICIAASFVLLLYRASLATLWGRL